MKKSSMAKRDAALDRKLGDRKETKRATGRKRKM